METITESHTIPVEHPAVDEVQAILQLPASKPPPLYVLLAHGAGASMESEFMCFATETLVGLGYGVLRFRYGYMERATREDRRLPPDRAPRLEVVHQAVFAHLAELAGPCPIVLAGKSMGGRISSHLVAKGLKCAGLLLLGYPLHPAGKPSRLRSEHFPDLKLPTLFIQGSRDALCDLELLRQELKNYCGAFELAVIDGGDHSFNVLKRSGRTEEGVRMELTSIMGGWLKSICL